MNPGMAEIRFGNNATHKKARRTLGARRAFYLFPLKPEQSGDVIAAATTSAKRSFKVRLGVRFAPIDGHRQPVGRVR